MSRKVFGNSLIIDPDDVRIVTVVPYRLHRDPDDAFKESNPDDDEQFLAYVYMKSGEEIPVDPDAGRDLILFLKNSITG